MLTLIQGVLNGATLTLLVVVAVLVVSLELAKF
jgi:hypothetical protein